MAKKTIEVDPVVTQKKCEMNEMLEQVKEVDYELAELQTMYTMQLEKLKATYEEKKLVASGRRLYLENQLKALFEQVPAQETKTQRKVSLLFGDVVIKKPTKALDYDKKSLLEWAKANSMTELISTKEVEDFKWSEYKSQLTITDDGIVNTETGELVNIEGLTVKEVPEQIQVKYD